MTMLSKTAQAIAISAGMLFLFSCSTDPEDTRDRMEDRMQDIHEDMNEVRMVDREEFEKERQDILGDLRDLRSDINDDLSDSERKLAEEELDIEDRNEHERLRKELEQHRTMVDRHIEKVEAAGMSDWDHVRTETRNILEQADLFYGREDLERRSGITGGDGTYDLEHKGDGTVNTNRDLDLNRNADEVR